MLLVLVLFHLISFFPFALHEYNNLQNGENNKMMIENLNKIQIYDEVVKTTNLYQAYILSILYECTNNGNDLDVICPQSCMAKKMKADIKTIQRNIKSLEENGYLTHTVYRDGWITATKFTLTEKTRILFAICKNNIIEN